MSETKKPVVHILYTDDYNAEEEERVRQGIAEETDTEFDDVRNRIKNLRSIRRDDLANREIEEFIRQRLIDRARMDWNAFKMELEAFDKRSDMKRSGYIILPDIGTWRGQQRVAPKRCDTLLDCVRRITANFSGRYKLRFRDEGDGFWIALTHHNGTDYYHIVELLVDTYEEEIDDEAVEVDDDFLYRLGHPSTPASQLQTFLRTQCREIAFWKRHRTGKPGTDADLIISTVS